MIPTDNPNDGNFSIGVLGNRKHLLAASYLPRIQELENNFLETFVTAPDQLWKSLRVLYYYEVNARHENVLHVHTMSESQLISISKLLLRNKTFSQYTFMCKRITALIGPASAGKTNKIMELIRVTYTCIPDRGSSVVADKHTRPQWKLNRQNHRRETVTDTEIFNHALSLG